MVFCTDMLYYFIEENKTQTINFLRYIEDLTLIALNSFHHDANLPTNEVYCIDKPF